MRYQSYVNIVHIAGGSYTIYSSNLNAIQCHLCSMTIVYFNLIPSEFFNLKGKDSLSLLWTVRCFQYFRFISVTKTYRLRMTLQNDSRTLRPRLPREILGAPCFNGHFPQRQVSFQASNFCLLF